MVYAMQWTDQNFRVPAVTVAFQTRKAAEEWTSGHEWAEGNSDCRRIVARKYALRAIGRK